MVDYRHPRRREYRWTHFYSNDILLITSMAILCIWSQAQGQSSIDDKTCSEQISCISCTNKTNHNCTWSLKNQQCKYNTYLSSVENLTVDRTQFCPNYIVKHKWIENKKYMQSTVDTAQEDLNDLIENLEVKCFVGDKESDASASKGKITCKDEIKYEEIETQLNENDFGFHITINGSQMMFENDTDYFHTGYDRSCDSKKDDRCVTCSWHDSQYRYYNRWCSANNTCTGLWHKSVKELVHANGTSRTMVNPNVDLMCPEIQIQLIGPKSGVLGGKTTVKFVVTNHWILIENKTMTVTVAGWDCKNATYDSSDRIMCTVQHYAPSPHTWLLNHKGPVRVTYKTEKNYTYAVTSKQMFKFVEPVLRKNVVTDCSLPGGGYDLTVYGRHLDAGDAAEVTISDRGACTMLWRYREQIVCKAFGDGWPMSGTLKVRFDGFPARFVDGTTVTEYSNFVELDEHQQFEGIASGGTWLMVSGRHFRCATSASLNVVRNGTDDHAECFVIADTHMTCRCPKIAMPSGADMVVTDLRLMFTYPSGAADPSNFTLALVTYPDPEFVDFHVQHRMVVINVRGPNRGYRTDVLTIRFPGNTYDWCHITERSPDRVVCVPSSSSVILADVRQLVVTIGGTFKCNVTVVRGANAWSSWFTGYWWILVVMLVVVTLTIIAVLVFRIARTQQHHVKTSSDPSELRPVDQFKPATS